jgi:hypothetical protein
MWGLGPVRGAGLSGRENDVGEDERLSVEIELDNVLIVLYYPMGVTVMSADGVAEPYSRVVVENEKMAKDVLEHLRTHHAVTIPSEFDDHGGRIWELKTFDLSSRPVDGMDAPLKPMTAERYDEIMIEKMGKRDQDV